LAALALCVGADVPVCLAATPALMWGKGEMIARLSGLPDFWLVLVNPGMAVSTASVFAALDARALGEKEAGPVLPAFQDFGQLVDWLKGHGNDLERPAISIAPVIKDVIAALNATASCRLARMSGSGATCFGLYVDEAAARRAEAALRITHPDWWVMAAPRL
jgi:4-diphosphocytidyl-2-C-methyl-D-erythritol kinase